MKTITLILTKPEYATIAFYEKDMTGGFKWISYHTGHKRHRVEIINVDKFREFLNDEMLHHFTMGEDDIVIHKNLKSIFTKLGDELIKEELLS